MSRVSIDNVIEALVSDRYKQTVGYLKNQNGYCCLGVMCEVYDPRGWKSNHDISAHDYDGGSSAFMGDKFELPREVADAYGFITQEGYFTLTNKWLASLQPELAKRFTDYFKGRHDSCFTSLAMLNDDLHFTFKEIAEVIRSRPPGLFSSVTHDEHLDRYCDE